MAEALLGWVDQVLGSTNVVGTPSLGTRRAGTSQCVLEVVDGHGRRWFAKRAATPSGWRREMRAYRRWVPALGSHAPTLHAADLDLRTLLVSGVPGRHSDPQCQSANRQAGALLRRLHEAAPARRQHARDRRRVSRRARQLLSEQSGLLTRTETSFVEDHMRTVDALPFAPTVPCHGDYEARNWLVDEAGTLRAIDFGNSVRETAAYDFSRLFYGPWWTRPDLAERFFEGYGRAPTDDEMASVQARVALYAVANIGFGVRRGSSQKETRGRARLADLMAGHQVQPSVLSGCSAKKYG